MCRITFCPHARMRSPLKRHPGKIMHRMILQFTITILLYMHLPWRLKWSCAGLGWKIKSCRLRIQLWIILFTVGITCTRCVRICWMLFYYYKKKIENQHFIVYTWMSVYTSISQTTRHQNLFEHRLPAHNIILWRCI
jgi:hypothetical protein